MIKHWTIHRRKTVDYYYNLKDDMVEENTEIPSVYVVRYDVNENPDYPCYEDQADFDTLEDAQKYLDEVEARERNEK